MQPEFTRVMQPRLPPRDRYGHDPNYLWITAADPTKDLVATLRRLVMDQAPRLWAQTRCMALYSNQDLFTSNRAVRGRKRTMPRQTCNYVKIYGDTLAGKLVQSNSKITTVTAGGDFQLWRLGAKIDSALEATFRAGRLYQHASDVAIDAINVGTGYLATLRDWEKDEVKYERWFPNELFVDTLESMYGHATMLFRLRYIKRENCMATFGKNGALMDIIARAGSAQAPSFSWTMYQPGMIELFEAWALPVGKRKGRHVIAVSSGVLRDDEWTDCRFPVSVFRAGKFPIGWYGDGFINHAGPAQIASNRLYDTMQKAAELGVAPYWVVDGGASVSMKQISNVEGHIQVTSDGAAPKWMTNPPFHPGAGEYAGLLKSQIRDTYGISDIEATAAQGFNRVDSDPALENIGDKWMARHEITLKNWGEFFFLDVAQRTLDLGCEIARDKKTYPVYGIVNNELMALDYKDFIELKDNCYTLQMAPMNYLPSTPGAKKKAIVEMKAEGLMTKEEALQSLKGPPDIDYLTAEVAAFENNCDKVIEQLMEGRVPDVSPLQKLEVMTPRVQAAGVMAMNRGAPEEVVTAFENWVAAAGAEAAKKMAMAAAPPTGGSTSASFGPAGSGLGGGFAGGIPNAAVGSPAGAGLAPAGTPGIG